MPPVRAIGLRSTPMISAGGTLLIVETVPA
jgi:hypothetical protein